MTNNHQNNDHPIRVKIRDRNIIEEIQTLTTPSQSSPEIFELPKKPRRPRKKHSVKFDQEAKINNKRIFQEVDIPKIKYRYIIKEKILNIKNTVIQKMNSLVNFFRKHAIHSFIIKAIVLFILSVVFVVSIIFLTSSRDNQLAQQYGMFAKLRELKQSHDYYTSVASKDELLISWVKMFSNWRYKMGGDPRYNSGDCVGAVYQFLNKWESKIAFEDVNSIIQRCKNLEERGEIQKRVDPFKIRHGDLIIFNFGIDIPKHIGIVYDYTNGWVRYMDVNAVTGTWGFERVKWGAPQVHSIYEVSFSFWMGNILKEMNKK